MIKKYNTFITETKQTVNTDDLELTNYRKSIEGWGDTKELYSFSNENDVDEIYNIIDSNLYFSLVARTMNKKENIVDDKLNQRINDELTFIESINCTFEYGNIVLNGVSKYEFVKKYIECINKK